MHPFATGRQAGRRPLALALGAFVAAAALVLLPVAGAAQAHVTVSSTDATGGGYAVLDFRAPNESDKADTVKLEISFPADAPLASVMVEPVPGWTAQRIDTPLPKPVTVSTGVKIDHAVTEVILTAQNGGLKPGEFGEFHLSVGPLPKSGTLSFPTVQTYSDGTRVSWSQPATGGAEPDRPAPTLTIVAATGATPDAASVSSDPWPLALSIAGLVVALIATGLAAYAAGRSRRPIAPRVRERE